MENKNYYNKQKKYKNEILGVRSSFALGANASFRAQIGNVVAFVNLS